MGQMTIKQKITEENLNVIEIGVSWEDVKPCYQPEAVPTELQHADGSKTLFYSEIMMNEGFFHLLKCRAYDSEGTLMRDEIVAYRELPLDTLQAIQEDVAKKLTSGKDVIN